MWLMKLQEDNKQIYEWIIRETITFTTWGFYKDELPITKSNLKIYLIGC